ncbi:MAG: NfeD family protein [Chromatiales bacterium]|nr:NfeD family protein [Chromatiales bacterium]
MMTLWPLDFWGWWIVGAALLVVELLAPGTFFLWLGIAAGVVGLVVWLVPAFPWQAQLVLFAVLTLASVVAWRAYLRRRPIQTDRPALNRRGEQYIGRTAVLAEPIANGRGTLKLDDTVWRIAGPDLAAGTRVQVAGVDGAVLVVVGTE